MNTSVKEDKKSKTVTLRVDLSKRKAAQDPVISFLTRDARILLREKGYSVSSCRKKDSITNHRETDSHSGEWVFALVQELANKEPQNRKKALTKEGESDIVESKTKTQKGK